VTDGIDPQLLSQFNVEIDQHLLAIEPVLGVAEVDELKRSDIDLLLREFHSIKGLARTFAATAMEVVAHEAESLLSPVRSGDRLFDAAMQELLVAGAVKPRRGDAGRQRRDRRKHSWHDHSRRIGQRAMALAR